MRPKYKPLVHREPPTRKTCMAWTSDSWDNLRASFDCTDWTIFTETANSIHELADTVCSYINFCVDTVVPKKTIRVYSNNKPWVTKEIKDVLNRKKLAYKNNNRDEKISVQKELKTVIRKGKDDYRKKIKNYFKNNNMKDVWKGMSLMSGRKRKKEHDLLNCTRQYANDLNNFYARFDCHDLTAEREKRDSKT
ncbi:hypothetical protein ElyMa_005431600 [Elysia marginata]|uniref:Uncharacterized protein n=1 Tax=Elysia marginata TaxID=1093978 RepID=A0AAV4EJX3_9GAST|nr:hypothetical protein ElyMa_005431600 [Elysia marginata]